MSAGIEVFQNRFIPVPMLPVGVPFFWPTEATKPNGVLIMNGDSFSATDYPELALVYPSLILPDMRGVVPRGMDEGSGRNVDASALEAGDYQADEQKSHNHVNITDPISGKSLNALYIEPTLSSVTNSNLTPINLGASAVYAERLLTSSLANVGGTETRGKAVLGYWLCYARTMFYDLSIEGGNAYYLGGHPANYYAGKLYTNNLITSRFNIVGDAPTSACRAWCNYNGVTNTINGSMNISSVTDNGVGDYTFNFTEPMPDDKFSFSPGFKEDAQGSFINCIVENSRSLSMLRVQLLCVASANSAVAFDVSSLCLNIFR